MSSVSVLEHNKQVVNEIRSKINGAKSVVLVDYRGLNVEEVTELRKKYREAGIDYKVYKNSMMRFAFKEEGLEQFNEFLTGPNGVAFSYEDAVTAAKITNDFAKNHKNLELKAGVVEGEVYGLDKITAIANLPNREALLTQLAFVLNEPIAMFARAIQGIVDKNNEVTEA